MTRGGHRRPVGARRALAVIVFAAIGLSVVVAVYFYRQSLERPDLLALRVARASPDVISWVSVRVRHPDKAGFTWSTVRTPLSSDPPAIVAERVATIWAHRVSASCGGPEESLAAVSHVFVDGTRTVYIDFDPRFFATCAVGTVGEQELLDALEQTVRANVDGVRAIVLFSGGIPLQTAWGHVALDEGRWVR